MSNISLGIDVSKLELSVALLKDNRSIKLKFSNDIVGFKKLYKWLCANKATDIKMCMEATGHYCFGIADFLFEHLDLQIKNIETSLHELISTKSKLKQDYENLQTIPGISSTTAITILALVPDISEFINARQLAAFAGLTPKQRTSGRSIRGKTKLSKMGSIRLRKALFFPAISAKRYNPVVKKFCDNLRNKSKCKMVVIGAAMRKLMHIIFAILKHKVAFNANLNSVTPL